MVTSFLHRLLAYRPYLVSMSLFILLCVWIGAGDTSDDAVLESSIVQPPLWSKFSLHDSLLNQHTKK